MKVSLFTLTIESLYLKVLSQLTVSEVQADEVCDFLWEHLVNDVRNLSLSLGRNVDEVLLAVHLVLSEIVERATMSKSGIFTNHLWKPALYFFILFFF